MVDQVKTIGLKIDPSGAETGGRAVKRTLQDVGMEAKRAQEAMDKGARSTAQNARMAQDELERLRAKYNPVFSVVQRYKTAQDEIRRAHQAGALSANEYTNALSRERQASLASIAALKGNTLALNENALAASRVAFQRRMLVFQLNDVAVSLAAGMNPLMVAAQQGSQISQIYMGQGGVVMALRETGRMAATVAARFGPIAAAAGVAALGINGIREQVREATGETATWGETFTALFQVIGRGINETAPEINALVALFSDAWDTIMGLTVDLGDVIIKSFQVVFNDIAAFLNAVPLRFKEAVYAIQNIFNDSENPFSAQMDALKDIHAQMREEIMNNSPLRDFASSVADQVRTNRGIAGGEAFDQLNFSGGGGSGGGAASSITRTGQAAQTAYNRVVDFQQQIADNNLATLVAMEKNSQQIQVLNQKFKETAEYLKAASQTPLSDIFGDNPANGAQGAMQQAVQTINSVFNALGEGRINALDAKEAIDIVRQSLKLFGDDDSVDKFINRIVNAQVEVLDLKSQVKTLSDEIRNIPDKDVTVTVTTYKVDGGEVSVNRPNGKIDDPMAAMAQKNASRGGGSSVDQGAFPATNGIDPMEIMKNPSIVLPKYAQGGITSGLSIVGEAGPEAVVPLPDGRTIPVSLGGFGPFGGIEMNTAIMADRLTALVDLMDVFSSDIYSILTRLNSASYYSGGGGSGSSRSSGSSGSNAITIPGYWDLGRYGTPVFNGPQTAYPFGGMAQNNQSAPQVTLNGGVNINVNSNDDPRKAGQTAADEFMARVNSSSLRLHG